MHAHWWKVGGRERRERERRREREAGYSTSLSSGSSDFRQGEVLLGLLTWSKAPGSSSVPGSFLGPLSESFFPNRERWLFLCFPPYKRQVSVARQNKDERMGWGRWSKGMVLLHPSHASEPLLFSYLNPCFPTSNINICKQMLALTQTEKSFLPRNHLGKFRRFWHGRSASISPAKAFFYKTARIFFPKHSNWRL